VGGAEGLALPEEAPQELIDTLPGLVIDLPGRVRMLSHERRAAFHTRQVESRMMDPQQRETERRMAEHHIWELHEKFPFSELVQPL